MEKEKKPEFVVTDRRKFNVDGEPRPDARVEQKNAVTPPSEAPAASESKAAVAEPVAKKAEPVGGEPEEMFAPETGNGNRVQRRE